MLDEAMSLPLFNPVVAVLASLVIGAIAFYVADRRSAASLTKLDEEMQLAVTKLQSLRSTYVESFGALPAEEASGRALDEDIVGIAGDKIASSYGVAAGGMAGFATTAVYAAAKLGISELFTRLTQPKEQRDLLARIAEQTETVEAIRQAERGVRRGVVIQAVAASAVTFGLSYWLLP